MPSALITGGSRGLGRALAAELARAGWSVTITGRGRDALEAAVLALGGDGRGVAGDVADPAHRAELAHLVGSRLDVLVNNASRLGPSPLPSLAEVNVAEHRRILETNVVAPVALFQELLPKLHGGVVVNISSDAAVEAYPGWGAYGSSKAALDLATRVLAAEHPDLGIYAFDPGDMRTDMHQAAFPGEDISDRPLPESVAPALVRLITDRPPSGRYGVADFLAEVDG